MPVIPATVLKKLYVQGSLRAKDDGFVFDLKNLIAPATITGIEGLEVNGDRVDDSRVTISLPNGNPRLITQISPGTPVQFPVGVVVTLRVLNEALDPGQHDLCLRVAVKDIGSLDIPVSDTVA
jgi:hypothetical protein